MTKLNLLAAPLVALMTPGLAAPAQASEADRLLTAEQIGSDVALARESYERIHPGYTRHTERAVMDAAWDGLVARAKATHGMTVGEFYIEMQKVLTLIRCDHTKVELPAALRKERNMVPVYLPFRWSQIEDRGIVSIPGDSGLHRGDELLEIDGRPIAEMIAEVRPLIPVDGFTSWSNRGGVSESLEFAGGAIDHFGALLWDIKPQASVKIARPDGSEHVVKMDRTTLDGWSAIPEAAGKALGRDFPNAVTYERLNDKVSYLRVDSFVNYRNPVKPGTIYDPIFDSIAAEEREVLILDLRNNGGGSTDAKNGLVSRLIDEKLMAMDDAYMVTLDHKGLDQHLWTWDKRAINPNPLGFRKNANGTFSLRPMFEDNLKVIKPKKNAFKGKLIVLTSDENSSGSTHLLGLFQRKERAVLVGEKTGGSPDGATAGVLFFLTLPESKVRARVPAVRYTADMGEGFEPGTGVTPDVLVERSVADFRAGRDAALEQAKALAGVR
ncbi:MAG: S41 family peptidase [Pseudomonadota bacterium]